MLTEAMWGRLSPLLPPQKHWTGRPAIDHRRFLEAILWLARTGSPWRDLPPELMNWRTAWRWLQRWIAADMWSLIVDALRSMAADAGWEAHLLDSSVVRAYAHAAGARKAAGGQVLGRSRGGFSTKLRLPCDARGRPVASHLTGGERHDLRRAAVRARHPAHRQARQAALEARGGDRRQRRTRPAGSSNAPRRKGIVPAILSRSNQPANPDFDRPTESATWSSGSWAS
jgi:transposase